MEGIRPCFSCDIPKRYVFLRLSSYLTELQRGPLMSARDMQFVHGGVDYLGTPCCFLGEPCNRKTEIYVGCLQEYKHHTPCFRGVVFQIAHVGTVLKEHRAIWQSCIGLRQFAMSHYKGLNNYEWGCKVL